MAHFSTRTGLALALGLALAGCGGVPENRSLYSVHQPVVDHTAYSFDINTGGEGLAAGEKRRLGDWFTVMDLHYGDRIALADPSASEATRAAVEQVLSHFGLLLSRDVPAAPGYVSPGSARVVILRASASVPHCPDWSAQNEANPMNATSSNYGCAVNGNLAAMIASPDDLIKGVPTTGLSAQASNDRAIDAYYATKPSGSSGALKSNSAKGN